MDILVDRGKESVTFTFPDGVAVEIMMVQVSGEDVLPQNDVNKAFLILRDELSYFETDKETEEPK